MCVSLYMYVELSSLKRCRSICMCGTEFHVELPHCTYIYSCVSRGEHAGLFHIHIYILRELTCSTWACSHTHRHPATLQRTATHCNTLYLRVKDECRSSPHEYTIYMYIYIYMYIRILTEFACPTLAYSHTL